MEGMSSSGGLEIGISCLTGPHFGTGGQKHTHTPVKHTIVPSSSSSLILSMHSSWLLPLHTYHLCKHRYR
jgi:hypothetical protein